MWENRIKRLELFAREFATPRRELRVAGLNPRESLAMFVAELATRAESGDQWAEKRLPLVVAACERRFPGLAERVLEAVRSGAEAIDEETVYPNGRPADEEMVYREGKGFYYPLNWG